MTSLTIGYSVLAERVKNIRQPKVPDSELLVVVQNPNKGTYSKTLDATYDELTSTGVAKSRNRALEMAKGRFLVFADDDIEFEPAGLASVCQYMDEHPEVAILLAQATDQTGKLRKNYPKSTQKLSLFNSARAATYEMVVRVESIHSLGVSFETDFGAGVENYLGDEYIFIADIIRAGGKGMFLPITIASHPEDSSGSGWGTDRDRIARAKVFTRVFGTMAPIIRLGFGLRRLSELGGTKNLARFVLGR